MTLADFAHGALRPPADNLDTHATVVLAGAPPRPVRNTPEQLAEHLRRTGGRVVTRFPPEPNGHLHIGHARAMCASFGAAEAAGGDCLLRLDDTNPRVESADFAARIVEMTAWLGWRPARVTATSDHFERLWELARELVRRGHAYVCHESAHDMRAGRAAGRASPWRDRPPAESLAELDAMRAGLWDEGAATLRMRGDPASANGNLRDLVAYRVLDVPHARAGRAWRVYPSYDFSHPLVDSLEDVTHSLCTAEFETRRAPYFWLLDALDLYKPVVREFARLEVAQAVLSKRRLAALVRDGLVDGWDDPRLLTLAGIRRRGVRPQAVLAFVRELGLLTRAEALVPWARWEHAVRADLDADCPRALAVLRPLRCVLDAGADLPGAAAAARFPQRAAGETEPYALPVARAVFIEADDFREADAPGYFGLAPGKEARLRGFCAVRAEADCVARRDAAGRPAELRLRVVQPARRPRGVLNWIADGPGAAACEVRLYGPLFAQERPGAGDAPDPASKQVLRGALVPRDIVLGAAGAARRAWQFERQGYFCEDAVDSTADAPVWNRVCTIAGAEARQAARGAAPSLDGSPTGGGRAAPACARAAST